MGRPRDRIRSFDRLKGAMRRHYLWAKVKGRLGGKVAWVTSGAPVELLLPFGIYPVYPESHGAVCAARRMSPELMEVMERRGYSQDLCGYALADIGHALTGRSPVGGLPRPDLLFCCTNICGTVLKWYETLADHFEVPLVLVDTPFIPDEARRAAPAEVPPHAVQFVKQQLGEAVEACERLTGRSYSERRLREVLDRAREAMNLWRMVLETGKTRPAPMTCFDAFILMNPIVTVRGTAGCVRFYRKLLDEMRSRAAAGKARVPGERVRLVWDNIPVWYKMRELARFFSERGVCLVADTYTNAWADNEIPDGEPLEAMAGVYTGIFLNRGLRARAAALARLVEGFDADGMVLHSNRSCKPYSFGQYDAVRLAQEQTGRPAYVLEADHVNSRHWEDRRVWSGLETFLESVG
jgi:benzoyl-CoA reductase/2-hydroxyglutaryl-CoA dehydratase subunit BcrC/BadD/HgdB